MEDFLYCHSYYGDCQLFEYYVIFQIGLFACCFMCSIYAVLFGTQEDVPMQSDQYNYPSTNNNVPGKVFDNAMIVESVAVDINLNVD